MADTLYDFYTGQGQNLPSIADRAKTFESSGLGNAKDYQGTAEQNTSLLNNLQTPIEEQDTNIADVNIPEQPQVGDVEKAGQTQVNNIATQTIDTAQTDLDKQISDIEAAGQQDLTEREGLSTEYEKLLDQTVNKQADFQGALEEQGVPELNKQLQGIVNQMRTTQASLNLGVATEQGRPTIAAFSTGKIAQMQNMASAQLGALAVQAQAVQGNIELARSTAESLINAQYGPIEQQIANQKEILALNYDNLSLKDQKRADELNRLYAKEEANIADEKLETQNIQNIMITAAENGADQETRDKINKATTVEEAINAAAKYLVTPEEPTKIGEDSAGNDVYGSYNTETGEWETQGGLNAFDSVSDSNLAKSGGSISWRNNNPLNIKYGNFASTYGATSGSAATDGGVFANFPSVETGLQAAKDLLTGSTYANLDLDAAMKRWSNSGYGDDVAPEYAGRTMSSLNDNELENLITKMTNREGWKVGSEKYGDTYDFTLGEKVAIDNLPNLGGKQITNKTARQMNLPLGITDKQADWIMERRPGNQEFQQLTTKNYDSVIDLLEMKNDLIEIRDLKTRVEIGPISTQFTKWKRWFGSEEGTEDFTLLEQKTGKQLSSYIKEISGAAVSEQEATRLLKNVPNVDQQDVQFVSALDDLEEDYNNIIEAKITKYGFNSVEEFERAVFGIKENGVADYTENDTNYLNSLNL